MSYVTPEQIIQAKEMDLLTYLQSYEPQELVHVGGNTYCTREHDSLKISNGKWHWFSRGIGGKTALDYLIKVKGYPFTIAVETITGRAATRPPIFHAPVQEQARTLLMPELNRTTNTVRDYLMGRGIHPEIIDYCIGHQLLFESLPYHNCIFVGYDKTGILRYAAIRGTKGCYKGEVTGSDKRYSFSIVQAYCGDTVHLFESAIDLLSYATLKRIEGQNWRQDALLSLAGVFQTKRECVIPIALEQFLKEHPEIRVLHLHLDNDAVGRGAARGIQSGLKDTYQICDEPPSFGKDVNDQLRKQLGIYRKKEVMER